MPISKILAATDFSAPAQRAVHRAALLARHLGARLQLVHALPDQGLLDRLFNRQQVEYGQMVRGAEHAIRKSCEEVGRRYGLDATWTVAVGTARRAIIDAVNTFGADLLVIGARGENESPFREPSLGGTALKLAAQSPTSLLLVRHTVQDHYRKLVIAVAAGEAAHRVLAGAQPFADQAECHLLHTFEAPFAARLRTFEMSAAAIDAYALEQHAAEEQSLKQLVQQSAFKNRLHPRVIRGEPVASVLREIEALQPDLIAIGKHDERNRNAIPDLGSVALRLAFAAPCDVLQIP